jgi:hypothetical protein
MVRNAPVESVPTRSARRVRFASDGTTHVRDARDVLLTDDGPCHNRAVPRLYLIALLVGCYSPSFRDCEVACTGGTCPSGLMCIDSVCRLPGMTGECTFTPMDDAAPDDEGNRDIPLEQLADANWTALCDYYVRCGSAEAVTTCVESFKNIALPFAAANGLERQVAAVKAGQLTYHPDKARECLETIAAFACERSSANNLSGPLACSQVFEGTVTGGGTCIIAEQCVSQICTYASCPNQCCTGTCTGSTPPAMRTVGQSCTTRDRCVDSYCSGAAGMCVALTPVGSPCTTTQECGPGATCRIVNGSTMTCEPLSPTLGVCSTTSDCKLPSDVCQAGKCQTGGLTNFTCMGAGECQIFHNCTANKCSLLPGLGEQCGLNQSCRVGYCSSSQCIAKLPDGNACDPARNGGDCAGGICDTSGKCASQPKCF